MTKIQIRTFFMVLLSGLILAGTSCSKDEDEKTNKDLLTGKNWKMTAFTINPPVVIEGVSFSDFYAFLPACTKDDLTKFNSDGTANFDEGATKCDSGDPQTTYGTWSLNTDQTVLTVTADGLTEAYTIGELTDTTLKFTYTTTEDLGNGVQTYTTSVTFVKQ
jgi:hypothetical protein